MDIKLRKSKKIAGVAAWFAGCIIMAVNMFCLALELLCYEDFPKHAGQVMNGNYQETEEFKDYILSTMDKFLCMSVADSYGSYYGGVSDGQRDAADGLQLQPMETYGEAAENDENREEREENAYWESWEEEEDAYWEGWEAAIDAGAMAGTGIEAETAGDVVYESDYIWDSVRGATYQYYDYYEDIYGSRYDVIYNVGAMDKKGADTLHGRMKYNTNILYRIENKGETIYTNCENLGHDGMGSEEACEINLGEKVFTMPKGYNYLLYYDGLRLRAWRYGREVNIEDFPDVMYSDWYIPGFGSMPADDAYVDSEVYMAVAEIPQIIIKRNFDGNGNTYYSNQLYSIYKNMQYMEGFYRNWIYGLVISILLLAAGFILRVYRKEAYAQIAGVTGKVWFEIKLFPVLAVLMLAATGIFPQLKSLFWQGENYIIELYYRIRDMHFYSDLRIAALVAVFILCTCIVWTFVNDIRYNKKPWEKSLLREAAGLFRTSMLRLPFSKRMVWYGIWVFLLGLLCMLLPVTVQALGRGAKGWIAVCALLAVILYFQFLYVRNMRRMAVDIDHIAGMIEAVRNGELQENIEISKESGLADTMDNLTDIRKGMDKAIKEQIKSNRMKVELIANVSHDIKTPLTSIVSYVELLKQEEGLPEHVKEYISILESKSQRLRVMVQDVFEVSKAASGELPMHMEKLDFGKLIRQTIADMQEEIEGSAVSIKCDMPDAAVMISADGDRLYRVFQNLIQNALKYSLDGSRVYIGLRREGNRAAADVKNTSKAELPANVDFTERFVRGDKSRTDGGSGLGLSIAQSFTEACGGSFKVETIADLFVVTVGFEADEG